MIRILAALRTRAPARAAVDRPPPPGKVAPSVSLLGGGPPDVLGARPFWPLTDVEFDAVTLSQILEAFTVHRAPVKEIFLARLVLDEPESLFDAYRLNRSCHLSPF